MTDSTLTAEVYLESCALGYAAAVKVVNRRLVTAAQFDDWACTKATLYDAGVRLAAARGGLDAAERAELEALRRYRDGVRSLREEIRAGLSSVLAIETIDVLELFASPKHDAAPPEASES